LGGERGVGGQEGEMAVWFYANHLPFLTFGILPATKNKQYIRNVTKWSEYLKKQKQKQTKKTCPFPD
jgi:hypothetical protein